MIYGIGNDILEIHRFQKIINKYDDTKLLRVFSKEELLMANSKPNYKNIFLAGRFSAKESFSKAMGMGIGKYLSLNEIEVLKEESGKPIVRVTGRSLEYCRSILGNFSVCISISHTNNLVFSVVIINQI